MERYWVGSDRICISIYISINVKALEEEEKMTPEQLAIKNVGKLDPKRHLEEKVTFNQGLGFHFYADPPS